MVRQRRDGAFVAIRSAALFGEYRAALAGAADLVVSDDEDLLVRNPFETIPIVTPAALLARPWGAG